MEAVRKSEKKRTKKQQRNRTNPHGAPLYGEQRPPTESPSDCDLLDTRDPEGRSVRVTACLSGSIATNQFSAKSANAWLDDFDFQENLPVHELLTYQRSHNATVGLRHLLDHGVEVNTTSDSGQTALHIAATKDHLECVKILVAAGANVIARDNQGRTPLDLAVSKPVARFLKHVMWYEEKKKEREEHHKYGEVFHGGSNRLAAPQDYGPWSIQTIPHRRRLLKGTSDWTEVAVHLGLDKQNPQSPQSSQSPQEDEVNEQFVSPKDSDTSSPEGF